MPFHDAYLRRTPLELAFAGPAELAPLSEAVDEECAERGFDASELHDFSALTAVQRFIARMRGAEVPPEAMHQFAMLTYHVVHSLRAGLPCHLVATSAARDLVRESWSGAEPSAPSSAGYVQLPRHLFWVTPRRGAPPEPVDGWHWTVSGSGLLHVLVAAGLREGRDGFSVVAIPEAPVEEAHLWVDASIREAGADFGSTLPGGDLETLYSLESAGELFKLVARVFSLLGDEDLERVPAASSEDHEVGTGSEGDEPDEAGNDEGGPRRSSLPYQRLGSRIA